MTELFEDSTQRLFNQDWFVSFPGGKPEPVTLPHAWNAVGWNYLGWKPDEPAGTRIYTKILRDLPAGALSLKFEGVAALARVFLNDTLIAENLGAYTPFRVSLAPLKRDNRDQLRVEVTDKASCPELPPREGSSFSASPRYRFWSLPLGSSMAAGGIWRDVWLEREADSRVDDLAVESFSDQVVVRATLAPECEMELSMEGATISIESAGPDFQATVRKNDAEHYRPSMPRLYPLKAVVRRNQAVIQTLTQMVAFREFTIRDCEFYLNGKPYFLRGQNGFPHCNIPHDRKYIAKYVSAVKAQGVEVSRFHTEPPSHAWLEECDRQGIGVIFELAIHGSM
ncbi:MAG: hypothetical protein PHS41_12725, partial [Victivallaceae bacterium]|nr:hypothetical protein [Victivallaceae bacterium]